MPLGMIMECQMPGNDGLVQLRKSICPQARSAEQFVDRTRSNHGLEFTYGVAPLVAQPSVNVNRSGSNQRNQQVLVYRQSCQHFLSCLVVDPGAFPWKYCPHQL